MRKVTDADCTDRQPANSEENHSEETLYTTAEIAEEMGMTEEELLEKMEADGLIKHVPLKAVFTMATPSMEPIITEGQSVSGQLVPADGLAEMEGKIMGVVIDSTPGSTGYYVGRLRSVLSNQILLGSDAPGWEPLAIPLGAIDAVYHLTHKLTEEEID